MLALFRKLFRRSKPDGVRALDVAVPVPRGVSLDGEWIVIRMPIPPEDHLLAMLFKHNETKEPMGFQINLEFDAETCEMMLQSANAVKRQAESTAGRSAKT